MATTAKQKGSEKWKTKQWFDVKTPDVFGNEVIGSIPASDAKSAVNRVLKVSLSWITHNPSHSFLNVGLRIDNAVNNAATTKLDFIENQFSYLHSLVKRHSDAIYTYDVAKSKDGKNMIVKLLLTTRNKSPYSKKHAVRLELSKYIQEFCTAHTADEFVKSILSSEFQGEGLKRLNKIVPLSKFEIKRIELKG